MKVLQRRKLCNRSVSKLFGSFPSYALICRVTLQISWSDLLVPCFLLLCTMEVIKNAYLRGMLYTDT